MTKIPKDVKAGEIAKVIKSIGEGFAKCCTTDTGTIKGAETHACKAVLSGDLAEAMARGHESLSCKVDVETT